MTFVWPSNEGRYATEGTSWWAKLCSDGAMWQWCQAKDEDLTIILLTFLPSTCKNFMSSLRLGKESITLEQVKSNLYFRELRLKEFGNGDEVFVFGLSMTDSAKREKKNKGKGVKKRKANPKDICNYYKKNQVIRSETIQRKQRKILLLLLFRMTPHWKTIWFWILVNKKNNILSNRYWT